MKTPVAPPVLIPQPTPEPKPADRVFGSDHPSYIGNGMWQCAHCLGRHGTPPSMSQSVCERCKAALWHAEREMNQAIITAFWREVRK